MVLHFVRLCLCICFHRHHRHWPHTRSTAISTQSTMRCPHWWLALYKLFFFAHFIEIKQQSLPTSILSSMISWPRMTACFTLSSIKLLSFYAVQRLRLCRFLIWLMIRPTCLLTVYLQSEVIAIALWHLLFLKKNSITVFTFPFSFLVRLSRYYFVGVGKLLELGKILEWWENTAAYSSTSHCKYKRSNPTKMAGQYTHVYPCGGCCANCP